MKIKARKENGEFVEFECKIAHVTCNDGNEFRIKDDYEHGFEVLAEHSSHMYVEPHVGNEVTIFAKQEF